MDGCAHGLGAINGYTFPLTINVNQLKAIFYFFVAFGFVNSSLYVSGGVESSGLGFNTLVYSLRVVRRSFVWGLNGTD
jgi:hypothetical protein